MSAEPAADLLQARRPRTAERARRRRGGAASAQDTLLPRTGDAGSVVTRAPSPAPTQPGRVAPASPGVTTVEPVVPRDPPEPVPFPDILVQPAARQEAPVPSSRVSRRAPAAERPVPARDRAGAGTPSHSSPFTAPRLGGLLAGRRAGVLAAAGVMVLVLAGIWIVASRGSASRDLPVAHSQPTTSPQAPATVATAELPAVTSTAFSAAFASRVKLGVFRGTALSEVRSFESWLGRDVDYVVDFSSRQTWSEIANPDYMIREWSGTRRRVVYSTGLLPTTGKSTIALGAKGNYDQNYATLARKLVAAGQDHAIIRLGWEFNLPTSRWSADDPAEFISYWRHVVKAMRAVPGQHFAFDWNPNVGDTKYDATQYYPGNAFVDYIGVDVYDVSWQAQTYPYPGDCSDACRLARQKAVWQRLYNGTHGLGFWATFAASQHKPMSLPEWGDWKRNDNHGGGDDPYFVEQMYRFIANPQNNVAFQAYFETATEDGTHRLMTSLPGSGKAYRKYFGR